MRLRAMTRLGPDLEALVQQSRRYQAELYPAQSIHQDDPQTLLGNGSCFIGAWEGDGLCGIGAVKIMRDDGCYGEIKNLFVDPRYRGMGVASAIMGRLERHLVENRVPLSRLETGTLQPESIELYRGLGYHERGPFGKYGPDPYSLFMEKSLR